ncbi:MAG TPA: hypothetical protein VEP30_05585 [Chthoniobacterales bacterium]|nr:hypothetical protein [Chthoniobacterales bacterium]
MKIETDKRQNANGLVVVVSVVATILALLGAAVSYTGHTSRLAQRSRRAALAVEIADGHLEYLFTNWRNIYRKTWTTYGYASGGTDYSLLGTNYFFTNCSTCTVQTTASPAPTPIANMTPSATPPTISLPSKTLFPTEPNYTVTQYRIQAVDPMIDLDCNENAVREVNYGKGDVNNNPCKTGSTWTSLTPDQIPSAAYGPNTWQYSFFYLAAVDVTVPAMGTNNSGTVKAKVRRVFEKRFDNPWTYAMFYVDDLEFQPSTPFTISGEIHTNGNLYIGTSNLTVQNNPTTGAPSIVEYGGSYVNGYSPNDTLHGGSVTAPNFVANLPPAQTSPYLPFGWNLDLSNTNGNGNDDSYHEIIERPVSGTDPLSNVRYYNQAGYRIVINADTTVTASRIDSSGNVTTLNGSAYNTWCANNGQGSSTTILQQNQPLYDAREGGAVKVTNVDISKIVSSFSGMTGWTGVVYLADAGATTYNADGTVKSAGTSANVTINGTTYPTTKRAFRLINGYALPSTGLTIVSENPVYIQGNYNTASTSSGSVPSNSGTYTDPDASGYTRKAAAVIADAVTILSSGWNDSNSASSLSSRVASANTTVNAAFVAGMVPSGGGNYSGGGENFIRLLEDWSSRTFCYYGSMVELFRSNQAIGTWGKANVYNSPGTDRWYYDDATFSNSSGPPGNLQIAAYLQQQRWYQVY